MARIFIVEGIDHAADRLAAALGAGGHEIAGTAVAAFEAYERVASTTPDLAVVDVRSRSGGDHVELALELRRRFDLLTVFVSGSAELAAVRRAGRADPAGFVARPFDEKQLRAAVELGLARGAADRARRGDEARSTVADRLRLASAVAGQLGRALEAAQAPADRRALAAEVDALRRAREPRAVPLQKIAARAQRDARERLGSRAELELSVDADVWVAADEPSLARAIGHLLAVTLQAYGSRAGTRLRLAVGRDEAGRASLEIVAGSGAGAPSRAMALPGLAPAAALAVAEAIVTAHGGELENVIGSGSVSARLLLPAVPAEAGAATLRMTRDPVAAAG